MGSFHSRQQNAAQPHNFNVNLIQNNPIPQQQEIQNPNQAQIFNFQLTERLTSREICILCLEPYWPRQMIMGLIPCLHIAHHQCLLDLRAQGSEFCYNWCPICRVVVQESSEQYMAVVPIPPPIPPPPPPPRLSSRPVDPASAELCRGCLSPLYDGRKIVTLRFCKHKYHEECTDIVVWFKRCICTMNDDEYPIVISKWDFIRG